MRNSHEAVDVATKRDLEDVRKDLSAEIADVCKDLSAQITDVRNDLSTEINMRFDRADTQIALLRKDVESIATGLLLKLGGVIVVTISAATAVMKFM